MKLSVIIVNYNVKYYLEQCLRSVFIAGRNIDMEVFVVDNNSSDDSITYLLPRFPQVYYIKNKENLGFSRANNQAIKLSRGEYVLLLNPDTIVTSHTFQDCIQFLDRTPKAGATGVAMYGSNGHFALESRRGLPVPWTSLCKMLGLTTLFPKSRLFGRYYMQFLDASLPTQIEVISGAFNMVRRTVLDQIGLLDEDFFMYGEDIDLSYRILQAGWKNYYLPTPILHYKGESTKKSSYRYIYIFYNAMLIFIDKHFRHRYSFFTYFLQIAVHVRAGLDIFLRTVGRIYHSLLCKQAQDVRPNLCDFLVFDYKTNSYDQILNQMVQQGKDKHPKHIGIHYCEQGFTLLPCGIIEDTPQMEKDKIHCI